MSVTEPKAKPGGRRGRLNLTAPDVDDIVPPETNSAPAINGGSSAGKRTPGDGTICDLLGHTPQKPGANAPSGSGDIVLEDDKATLQQMLRDARALISIDDIEPNPFQPRKKFDEAEMQDLIESIATFGVLEPPLLRPKPGYPGKWQLVAGERRWRAVLALRFQGRLESPFVDCTLREIDDIAMLEMAVEENIRRQEINAIEEAWAYAQLEQMGRTQEQIGKRFKLSQSAVSNRIRLLGLPEEVKTWITEGALSASHGVALLSLAQDKPALQTFARRAAEEKWPSKQLEDEIRTYKAEEEARNQPALLSAEVTTPAEDTTAANEAEVPTRAADSNADGDTVTDGDGDADGEKRTDGEAEIEAARLVSHSLVLHVPRETLDIAGDHNKPMDAMKDKSRTFMWENKRFVAVGALSQAHKYLSVECYRVIPADQHTGQTYSYAEILKLYDSKERERGDRQGWKFSDRGTEYVAVGQRLTFVPDEQKDETVAPSSTAATPATTPALVKTAKEIAAEKAAASTPATASGSSGTSSSGKGSQATSTPAKSSDAKSTAAQSGPRKATDGMTPAYVPTEPWEWCENRGYAVSVVYDLAKRVIALAEARSITAQDYLTALENE